MTYREIIERNCQECSPVSWWPKFAYHYTDITNAVSILYSGSVYSRAHANELGVMKNDNASKQVIDMTNHATISSVRFYFRPLTPTQYYNEGYKHPQIRYHGDPKANTPVPVFFLFNLEKLLLLPGVKFSETSQAGYGSKLLSGPDEFEKLDFKKIYSNRYTDDYRSLIPYRHAEILHPDMLRIDSCLEYILCRNDIEKTSLLNMLAAKNSLIFRRYQSKIKVCKSDMFYNNGLYIDDCRYYDNNVVISFSDKWEKYSYLCNNNTNTQLSPIQLNIELDWYNSAGIIHHISAQADIDYEKPSIIKMNMLPKFPKATKIRIRVYIEGSIMCCVEQTLGNSELIK